MKSRLLALLSVVFFLFSSVGNPKIVYAEDGGWENVGPGVDFKQFLLAGPAVAYVARMERSNEDVIIESSIAQGRLYSGSEVVSAMANRYNGAVNFWPDEEGKWGATNRVLVAINGFYIEDGFYRPQGGMTHSGWYAKWHGYLKTPGMSEPKYPDGWGFGWKLDRTPLIGECIYHLPSEKQMVWSLETGAERPFHMMNVSRKTGDLVIYTSQYNWRTPPYDPDAVDILVEVQTPAWIMPHPNSIVGIVKEIKEGSGGTIIPFDHVVISTKGYGDNRDFLLSFNIGDEIRISQELNYNADCNPYMWDWNKTFASIEGHFYFLKNGEVNARLDHPNARIRDPRTAVAFNDDYVYFIVVDGRQAGYSLGVTIGHLGNFALEKLDAAFGISLDGGGSSTMVVNGQVVNRPSDICYHLFLPQIISNSERLPPPLFYDPPEDFRTPTAGKCERPVGNGMMMVAVEHHEPSTSFEEGESVQTKGQVGIRLGPGTNYPIFLILEPGDLLEVVKHPLGMDGIFAKGQNYWKVKTINGVEGWVTEAALESVFSSTNLQQP